MVGIMAASFPFLLLFIAVFLFAGVLVGARRHQERSQRQFELQSRLIDKFGSPDELRQFLDSESGKRLMGERRPFATGAKERILRSVQAGIVLVVMGQTAFALKFPEAVSVGLMASALGAGLLISAAVVYFLSKRWGLFNGQAH